jgi:hypothetical protein
MSSNNVSNKQSPVELFIPFIAAGITKSIVKRVFILKSLGTITSIELHDKKILNKCELKSANHSYAFITIEPNDSNVCKNLLNNVANNKVTYVFYKNNDITSRWEIKPHLSVKCRIKKGFNIIIPSHSSAGIASQSSHTTIQSPVPSPRNNQIDNIIESEPEWMDYPTNSKFEFRTIPEEFPFLDICKIIMSKPSLLHSELERDEIDLDYSCMNNTLERERISYSNYSYNC